MKEDPHQFIIPQVPLFELEESTGSFELFPAVWVAAEDLVASDSRTRRSGLERLLELGAARFSPLIAYLLYTRLTDPNIALRAKVVRALGDALGADKDGRPGPENVRQTLCYHLGQMRTRQVFALLQVLEAQATLQAPIARLVNACPYAGAHLADILSDRKAPFEVRARAAQLIGQVGFLDALPALERLAARLEARQNGQGTMPFAPPPAAQNEVELLPAVKTALDLLRAP